MRNIDIGDLNRVLLQSSELMEENGNPQPSFSYVDVNLNLRLTLPSQNFILSELMGKLPYSRREPLRRMLNRLMREDHAGNHYLNLLKLWSGFADQFLEQRHAFFIKPSMYEHWRHHTHSIDEDLPALAKLALQWTLGSNDDFSDRPPVDHFSSWPTFSSGDDRQLDHVLKQGIACQHLHLAACYPASYYWVGLMNGRFSVENFLNVEEIERLHRYPVYRRLSKLLIQINLARALRIEFFSLLKASPDLDASRITEEAAIQRLRNLLQRDDIADHKHSTYKIYSVWNGGSDIRTDYAQELCGLSDENLRRTIAPSLLGERLLEFLLLRYISCSRNSGANREHFRKLVSQGLWSYIQTKNSFLGIVQHCEGIAGFDYFEYTLRMASWLKEESQRDFCAREIGRFLQESGSVVKLELMRSPCSDNEEYRNVLDNVEFIRKEMDNRLHESLKRKYGGVQVGMVLHFIKGEGEKLSERLNAEGTAYRIFHAGVRDRIRSQADILEDYISSDEYGNRITDVSDNVHPTVICGIDAANRELRCPPEIFGEVFRKPGFQSIGRSFHVGEDFVHLATGIRRIYEAITFLELRAGDRLGHCVALGIDPELWVHYNPVVRMHLIDLLDDSVFEWSLLQEYQPDNSLRLGELERRIARYSMDIYGCPIDAHVLQSAWMRRADSFLHNTETDPKYSDDGNIPRWVTQQGAIMNADAKSRENQMRIGTHNVVPSSAEINHISSVYGIGGYLDPEEWPTDPAERVLVEYLYDIHTIGRAIQQYTTETSADLQHFARIQKIMRELVMSLGITIESNPSSNWLIGGFERLNDVPAVQWSLKYPDFPITINADDPSTFSTSISNEYFFLYSCLRSGTGGIHGLSRLEALDRIRYIRQQGIESSFLD